MTMPDDQIRDLALDVAKARFGGDKVRGVEVAAGVDYWDDEVIRVTIALADGTIDGSPPDAVVDTLVDIRRRLEAAGETRPPTISYDEPEIDQQEEPEIVGGPGF